MIRDRMYVLHLLHLGFSRKDCAAIVGCHPNSVSNYIKRYQTGGLDLIRQTNYSDSRHELYPMYEEVDKALDAANCSTVSEAAELLRTKFGYQRSQEVSQTMYYIVWGINAEKRGHFLVKLMTLTSGKPSRKHL